MSFGWELVEDITAENPVRGDLKIINRRFVRIEAVGSLTAFGFRVAQSVRVHFRWWRGEWFLDTRRGVPYLEQVLGQKVSTATLRTLVRREALRVSGVADVPEILITRNAVNRRTTVDFVVTTTEGELVPVPNVSLGRAA
jgi:hypothetical protein